MECSCKSIRGRSENIQLIHDSRHFCPNRVDAYACPPTAGGPAHNGQACLPKAGNQRA